MEHEYLLSICMIVKDEEKNLRRCLCALQPIIEKRDIELIVVDTGSTDSTVDIAGSFTDKLYFHTWNNHFSDMRNVSISYAKGRYIFILDADEVLLDPVYLYELITDESIKSFNTLSVVIKNLTANGGHTIINQERIFRNDGDFRYAGSVHNQPQYKPPVLSTDICLEHYGYLFNDKELREKKFKRTGNLLKEELSKNSNNLYYRYQMSRTYIIHGDYKDALIEIRKAYELIKGNSDEMKRRSYIFGTYAHVCSENNEYSEAVRICKEGINIQPDYTDLYYVLAISQNILGRKAEALNAYVQYIDLVDKFDELSISKSHSIEMNYKENHHMDNASFFIAGELFNSGDYAGSYKYLNRIKDDQIRMALFVQVLLKLKKYDELKEIYLQHKNERLISRIITDTIEMVKANYNLLEKKELEAVFCSGDDTYSLLNKARNVEIDEKRQIIDKISKTNEFNELPDFYADLFVDIGQDFRQFFSILKRLNGNKIKQYIKRIIDKNENWKDFFENFLQKENIRDGDYNSTRAIISIAYVLLVYEAAVLKKTNGDIPETYYNIFRKYIENGIKSIALLYNMDRLRLYYSTLTDMEDLFFIALHYAKESSLKGEYKAGIKYFTAAAKANPYLVCYMKKFQDEVFPQSTSFDEEDEL